jgi:CubicO group peptidase (beta-lactamase class C family)
MTTDFLPGGLDRLLTVLQSEIDHKRLPGCVVWISRRGNVALHEALGAQVPAGDLAGRDEQASASVPMQRESVFRIYSMTKPITSMAAMQLVAGGRLVLSDPVSKFIPSFARQQVMQADGSLRPVSRPATIHDLLRHTAGLSYEWLGTDAVHKAYSQAGMGDRQRLLSDQIGTLGALPLLAEPGTCWEYSRATDVLGRVIEVATDQPLGAYLQDAIFTPLRMSSTAFQLPATEHHRIAEPFKRDPDRQPLMKVFDPRPAAAFESGGGGLLGTAEDYGRFMQMMLNRGELDGARLLPPHLVDFMTADHAGSLGPQSPGSQSLLLPGYGFGLGFAVRRGTGLDFSPGSAGLYYWGGLAGTTFFIDPTQQLCATLMLQAPNQREYYRHLFRTLVYAALV